MTHPEIEAFLSAAKTGTITAAAEQLYVTQPALSRRIRSLEAELGYPLLKRGRGVRAAELTEEGKAFLPLAEQYDALWREARGLPGQAGRQTLRLSSVGSVSNYLLPEVFSRFLAENPGCGVEFHHHHSLEAYGYVARGEVDMALISDDMFAREVQTIPLFREEMLLALSPGEKYDQADHPTALDGRDEIRLPWNPEYDLWHDFWFPAAVRPRVMLDQMPLLEYFLRQRDLWAVLPASAARRMAAVPGLRFRRLKEGPPERFIYYLMRQQRLPEAAERFLTLLAEELRRQEGVTCLL